MNDNIISGLWIGPRLSRFEHNSIKSYLKQGYQYNLYTYDKVENIPEGTNILDANEILDKKYFFHYEGLIAPFSDLFRYKLLYDKGGVWSDCDIICVRRLPSSKKMKYIFVAERTILKGAFNSCMKTPPYTCKKKKVLNSFIRAPKGSELMRIMYEKSLKYRNDYLESKTNKKGKEKEKVNGNSKIENKKHNTIKNNSNNKKKTKKANKEKVNIGLKSYHWGGGSKTLEKLIEKMKMEKYITEPEFAFPINWWDFKYAFMDVEYIKPSKGWDTGTNINDIFNKKETCLVTIHNGWLRNQGLDKNAKYPENSLFERLDRFIN